MRVYLTYCPDTPGNPVIRELGAALSGHSAIDMVADGLERFWDGPFDCDVIHIQWPEALFKWRTPDESQLRQLRDVLRKWGKRSTLVATIHNRRPHIEDNEQYRKAYELIYTSADGIIHMGKASRNAFRADYGSPPFQIHTIIPHSAYASFSNDVSREEAYEHLGLQERRTSVLVLGAIRHAGELHLLLNGFASFKSSSKRLIIAGRILKPSRSKIIASRLWLESILRIKLDPRISVFKGMIPDDEVQWFMSASDFLVIPRTDALNSGGVSLGFTFGKVVVGPDIGVIGEVLRETGNPVFDPHVPSSLGRALKRAETMSAGNKGLENRKYAEKHWALDIVSDRHCAFYKDVLRVKRKRLMMHENGQV